MYMNNIVGQPVERDDFFDREQELGCIWESIREGNHVVLLAPRRVGKTSLAYRIGEEASRSGWRFVMVDAQKDRDELSFLSNLFENLKSAGVRVPVLARLTEGVSWIRRNFNGKFGGGGFTVEVPDQSTNETATLENLVQRLFGEIEESKENILIAVDELPVFLTELERAEQADGRLRHFLNWFRALRMRYGRSVRWLLLGSVGLDSFVEARRLTPAINDLEAASLGAYSEDTAVRFLKELGAAKNVVLSDAVCQAVLQEIGWPLPFFLQLVFQRLCATLGRPPKAPLPADVQTACRQLLSSDFYKHFEPWRGRLAEGLEPDAYRAAMAVLNTLCARAEGLPRPALQVAVTEKFPARGAEEINRLLAAVLAQLERDGYILRDEAKGAPAATYSFRSFLLRRYWLAREVA
jgi:AAA+ ATPase superfamily predicted ATPase